MAPLRGVHAPNVEGQRLTIAGKNFFFEVDLAMALVTEILFLAFLEAVQKKHLRLILTQVINYVAYKKHLHI